MEKPGNRTRRALGGALVAVSLASAWMAATPRASSGPGPCGYTDVHLHAVTSTTLSYPLVTRCTTCPGFSVENGPAFVTVPTVVKVEQYTCVVIEE